MIAKWKFIIRKMLMKEELATTIPTHTKQQCLDLTVIPR